MSRKSFIVSLMLMLVILVGVNPAFAQTPTTDLKGDFTVAHYWSGGFGLDFIEKVINDFVAMHPDLKRAETPVDHEQFKTRILVQLAGTIRQIPSLLGRCAGAVHRGR